ncbi:MAG: hypothetical protein SFX19_10335 [Alphaproteobacteria bacterium]|nr:hypothetical protein [Alphaproteobacteria bacterium]
MTNTPGTYDFTIYQGATFNRVLTWKDENNDAVDLTGSTARMQLRESVDDADPFLSLTTENGGIALGGAAGTITLAISAADTAVITKTSGVYDLELVSAGGIVTRLLAGKILVSKEITR